MAGKGSGIGSSNSGHSPHLLRSLGILSTSLGLNFLRLGMTVAHRSVREFNDT